ncbi:MAG: MFS transporter, partial [Candidatus Methanomethylophilaceae archaeon]|nr:MFS transporter [Candidatus Methanomethylophilaceae archaeon]
GLFIMAFIFIETHEEFPLMQMKLFRNSRFSRSLLALFLNYASSYCTTFFLSLYLQNMGAMTATQAGLVLMAQPVMQVIFTLLAGKLSDRIDKRILPTLGMLITAVSLFMLLTVGITLNLPLMIAALIVGGIGYGVFSAPNTSATMSYVQPYEYNQASAMIATMRQIGMMLSMGVATCLISIHLGSTAALEPSNYPQFMEVMKTAWIMCISFSLVGAVISWFRGKSTAGE